MKKSLNHPLNVVSYLQRLANSNPHLVAEASQFFNYTRDQYNTEKISAQKYEELNNTYIDEHDKL
jgi:CTP:phosphocholine cytidylyltransferase-like protein